MDFLFHACAVYLLWYEKDGRFTEIRSFSSFWPANELVGVKSLQQWRIYTSPNVWFSNRRKLTTV